MCTEYDAPVPFMIQGHLWYQNSIFKIGLSLFGCAEKYTEQNTHCALWNDVCSIQGTI